MTVNYLSTSFSHCKNRGFRGWGGKDGVKWKCSKYCLGHFLICLKLLILKVSGLDLCWKWRAFFQVLMTFGDIWVGMSKRPREIVFFVCSGRVHSWVFGCLVRMGKTQIWAILLWRILKKGKFLRICLCRCRQHYIFHMGANMAKFTFAPVSGCGPKICTKMCFVGGMLGWWSSGHLTWP